MYIVVLAWSKKSGKLYTYYIQMAIEVRIVTLAKCGGQRCSRGVDILR